MLKVRLEKFHEKIVCEDFILLYNLKNIAQLPTFEQAVIDSTSSKFTSEKFALLQCFSALFLGTGQRPTITRAKKSIALFQIRQGNLLGLKVTLRKSNLYNVLNKLLIFVVPKLLSDWKGSRDDNQLLSDASFYRDDASNIPILRNTSSTKGVEYHNAIQKKSLMPNATQHLEDKTQFASASPFTEDDKVKAFAFTEGNGNYVRKEFFKISSIQVLGNNKLNLLRKIKQKHIFLQIPHNDEVLQSMQNKSNLLISSKNATYFPEVSELLLFFNSVTGFSFDCLFSIPLPSVKTKAFTLSSSVKGDANVFSKKTKCYATINCNQRKNQFISAFQYPVCKI